MLLVETTISWMATWFMKNCLEDPPPSVMLLLKLIPSQATTPSWAELPWISTWPHASPMLPPTSWPPPAMLLVMPTVSDA